MNSQTLNNIDESIPIDYAAVEEPNHGRFPRHQVDVTETNYREVNVDNLSESDFEGMKDSGLAYSDHDYIGANPNAKVAPETSQFPVMGGVTDQYLNGETNDPCAERTDNRMPGMSISGSVVKKQQHPSALRTVKSDDYGASAAHHAYPQPKPVPYKDVTQPKKSGRPSKNETREAGDRLMARAMVKAGMQGHHTSMQSQQLIHVQGMHPIQDHGVHFRGAAPIVTPARGQKITPRGRPTIGLRRDIPDDRTFTMVTTQQGIPPSKPIPTKKTAHFGSAQAAEDAHTREMIQAAQNALAPSNAIISGMSVQPPLPSHSSLPHLHPHPSHHDPIVLPPHNRPQTSSLRYDDGDLPRTPGKVHAFTPISSPHSAVRTVSESHEMNMQFIQEPLRTNSDGLPVTPGGGRKTPLTSRTPRSRMSISESTGSQTSSPQRPIVLSPSRSHVMIQSRPIPSSPQQTRQMPIGGHLKPTGPSTMASAQMQMSLNAPLPSLHTQNQSMVVQRQPGESPPKRGYYDVQGGQAAPLITATGSMTYNPRRKKEKDTGETVDAAVSRNVKAILQSDKTPRLSTTRSDISLSPTNDMSDEEMIHRGGHIEETAYESKRTASKKKDHKMLESAESNSDESESEKWEISCICGQKEDDGEEMVQCNQCILRWEHVDCIFPRTKKAPSGNTPYFCHVCKPRPTELTREEARAYQDRVKKEKEEAKNQELKRKLAERARRKEENSRKPSSVIRNTPKASVPLKSEKTGNSSYREILKNECSTSARRLVAVSRLPNHSSDIVNTLRNNPIIRSLYVESKVFGIVVTEEVCEGAYIAELLGSITLEKECRDRDLVLGSLNDHTFLFEMDQAKFIIDARKCGNIHTKYLRRSCKPNAELEAIMCGSEIHIMIKATQRLEQHDEVSIKLEDGWMKMPRPAQGCGCDKMKEKGKCELERFFNQAQSVSSSSRKSLPVNGTTPMSGRSPPIRQALTEKKKVTSAKKVITKKGKRKGTIKLPRRKMKGGSSRGRETADDIDDEEEGESDMVYDESEEEKEKRGRPRGRGRRNTDESSDRTVKEKGKKDIKKKGLNEDESLTLNTSSRSTRLRSDSEMKKETTLMINEDINEKRKSKRISESETGESKKGGKKSLIEKREEEVKEEWPSTNTTKKTRKSWPVMDYTLPSERGKDREERKLQAEIERIERQKKEEKSGSKPRGRPPASKKEEKKGKDRDDKIPSSGRRKRRAESEDEDDDTGRISAVISTPIYSSRKRLSAAEGRKKEDEEASSPIPSLSTSLVSLTHSIVSSMTDDTTHSPPVPASGKKKLLLRYQEAEKEKAAAIERSSRREVPSSTWTPTRSTRVNKEEKGEKGKMESFANRREMKEKDEGNREDMRRHAIYLRDTLPPSTFSIGSMSGTGVRVETPSHSSLVSPSIPSSSIVPPSSTRVPSVSTPMEKEKTVKKSAVSYEEYKKRKKEGEIISGEQKKDRNEKKEEVVKKSFMPRVDSSVYVPPSLPNVTLPGLDEHVGLDELKRRVYDESPRRGGTSSSISTIGKSEPTPKRQSINERLKNEFSLPMLSTPPPLPSLPSLPSSSTTLLSTSTPLSTISMPSLPNEDVFTPAAPRIHKNRLSDTKAPNVGPPGVMSECPRPISLDSSISSSIPVIPSTTSSSFFYS